MRDSIPWPAIQLAAIALPMIALLFAQPAARAQSSAALGNGGFSSESNESGTLGGIGGNAVGGTPAAQPIAPLYDFGSVYNGTVVRHTFALKNTGTGPLAIGAVQTSCGCTAAEPTRKSVAPGDESQIAVSFDTTTDHGPATRTITVYTNDPKHKQVQFTMKGDVKVQVEADPSLVMFDKIKRGAEETRQVTITDQMPDKIFKVGQISNTNPNIKISSQPLSNGKPGAVLTITLLKSAQPGSITDLVKVATSRTPLEIPVSGTVLGDLNVNPPQVTFGVVPHHASALRIVRLINSGENPVKVTGISTDNTSVTAAVEPVKAGKEYKITVQLRPNTPDGVLHGMLAIKTDDPHQQDVRVPFYGIVGSFKS